MNKNPKLIYLLFLFSIMLISWQSTSSRANFSITELRVEYAKTPLGIDVEIPRFSWQMEVDGDKRGFSQKAYQLVVKNSEGDIAWESEKINDDRSLNIAYAGSQLEPSSRYDWTVTVWDQDGKSTKASSWFETGLMDPDISAWSGARWIGGTEEDLVFYSPYLSVFKFHYSLKLDRTSKSTKAGFIFGANDTRLMDKYKNIHQVKSEKDESYIKLEIDMICSKT